MGGRDTQAMVSQRDSPRIVIIIAIISACVRLCVCVCAHLARPCLVGKFASRARLADVGARSAQHGRVSPCTAPRAVLIRFQSPHTPRPRETLGTLRAQTKTCGSEESRIKHATRGRRRRHFRTSVSPSPAKAPSRQSVQFQRPLSALNVPMPQIEHTAAARNE